MTIEYCLLYSWYQIVTNMLQIHWKNHSHKHWDFKVQEGTLFQCLPLIESDFPSFQKTIH